jgi:pimeloyl-ACP methyl ester carboxylesterase
VFLFHGLPGSRLQRPTREESLLRAGVRLLTVDRPGIGLSDPKPGRRLLDWPEDVGQLADALGIRRFRVVGVSGGGPYALACAYALGARVTTAATVGSLAPLVVPGHEAEFERLAAWFFRGLRHAPRAVSLTVAFIAFLLRRSSVPSQVLIVDPRCPSDREVLLRDDVRELLTRDFQEATRQGVAGTLDDARVLSGPWGFDPREVRTRIDVWHGTADTVVRPVMGEYLARTLPCARPRFIREGGHFSICMSHTSEILASLFEPAVHSARQRAPLSP